MLTDTVSRSSEEDTLMVKKSSTLCPKDTLNRFKSETVHSFVCLVNCYFSDQSAVLKTRP